MDRKQIFERVNKILLKILASKPTPDSMKVTVLDWNTDIFTDVGLDSLESLDLLTGLEEEFDVNPDQYEAVDKRKISQIVDYVIELSNGRKL